MAAGGPMSGAVERAQSMPSPRVLILIASDVVGGPGKNLLSFLREVEEREHYHLCAFARRSKGEGEFIRTARRQGLAPTVLEEQFRFDPRTIGQALRVARRRGANVVQSHEYKSHTVAFAVSRILGIPWVAFAHGWTRDNRKVELFHAIDRRLLKRATRAVAVSPALKREVERLRRGKPTEMVLNAIDPGELPRRIGGEEQRRRLGLTADQVLIGAVGRLSREKGQEVLLRAFALAAPQLAHGRLVIVGDGPDRAHLVSLAEQLGIAERVRFVGHQKATADYYEAMDLLVLPSYSEGLPNAVLEAMALGTPVLACEVGGVPEIIEHDVNGWLLPPGSPTAMAQELIRLCDRRTLANAGRQAQQSLYPKFSPARRVRELRAVYTRVLTPLAQRSLSRAFRS